MQTKKLTFSLSLLVALAVTLSAAAAHAETFNKGDHVVLAEDTPLYLNNVIYKPGKKGDEYTILLYRPETKRVYVAAKDESGHEIALNLPDSVVSLQKTPLPAALPAAKPTEASTPAANADTKPADANAAPPQAPAGPDGTGTAKVQNYTYLVTTDEAQGSAFLAQMGGKVYLVTNYHVVKGASRIECANSTDSFKITGGAMEVANDRDLVRFPTDKKAGLNINASPALDGVVAAYGNSGGKDVITKLDGKILGVGPQEIEVSCEFIPGNSGGPIADTKGDVVGIATYVATQKGIPDWVKKGTRFEGTRRFGVRLTDDIAWSPIDLAEFQKETKVLATLDGSLEDFAGILTRISHAPFHETLQMKYASGQDISNFVEVYNLQCKDLSATLGKSVTTQELDAINRKFHGRIRTHLTNLARILDSAAQDFSMKYRNLFTIPYTKDENTKLVSYLHDMSQYIKDHSAEMTPADMFHFKQRDGQTAN